MGTFLPSGLLRSFTSALLSTALFASFAWSLTPGETHTVTLSQLNSNGTTTQVDSTTAVADANGKITFSFTNSPTSDDVNFLVITILDSTNTVVRQAVVPAPGQGATTECGANPLANVQAAALLEVFAEAQTDDPIFASFAFMILRDPALNANDISSIATGSRAAILGTGGFVQTLENDEEVTATQLANFRANLVNNSEGNDLTNFSAIFKQAADNAETADQSQTIAGSLIADIFIEAADAAGIDLHIILNAFDTAGEVAENQASLQPVSEGGNLSDEAFFSMIQAIDSFFDRLSTSKIEEELGDALVILGASDAEIDRFNEAVEALLEALQTLDEEFADFYEDPGQYFEDEDAQGNLDGNDEFDHLNEINNDIDQGFEQAFDTFLAAIRSTDAEITTLRAAISAATGINPLPQDVGRGRDFDGNQVNWPIPRTVLFNFVSAMALEGGAINYVRDDTPIPPFMDFLPDDGQGNPTRSDFAAQGIPSPFKEVLEIQEDLEIIQHSLWDVFGEFDDGGQGQEDLNPPLGQPDEEFFEDGHNFEDEHDAGVEFEDRIDSIISNITGDLSEDEVEAMIHVLLEPDIHQ